MAPAQGVSTSIGSTSWQSNLSPWLVVSTRATIRPLPTGPCTKGKFFEKRVLGEHMDLDGPR